MEIVNKGKALWQYYEGLTEEEQEYLSMRVLDVSKGDAEEFIRKKYKRDWNRDSSHEIDEVERYLVGTRHQWAKEAVGMAVMGLKAKAISVLGIIIESGLKWEKLDVSEKQVVLKAISMVMPDSTKVTIQAKEGVGSYEELVHKVRKEIK